MSDVTRAQVYLATAAELKLNMTKGLIPMPPTAMAIIDVSRRYTSLACRGYDWLGYRPFPDALVLHRAQSPNSAYATLEGYFNQACCPALTDMEVNHITGKGKRFVNVPGDSPSGWASGPISAPYGDGKAFNDRWPYQVNTRAESCEILGRFNQPGTTSTIEDPVSPAAQAWLAQWMASRAHDYGITYLDFPTITKQGGRSYITWHEEFTYGTGKVCPGQTVKDLTPTIIEMAREIMRKAQTMGTSPMPSPNPETMAPDGQPYPAGLDEGICSIMFGILQQDGRTFGFNPAGVISKAWYSRGKASGQFPFLYEHFKDSATGREYFIFSDGAYIWRPSSADKWRWGLA